MDTTEKRLNVVLFDLKEASKALGLTERTIRTYINSNRIRAVKIGRKWMISQEALEAFCRGDVMP